MLENFPSFVTSRAPRRKTAAPHTTAYDPAEDFTAMRFIFIEPTIENVAQPMQAAPPSVDVASTRITNLFVLPLAAQASAAHDFFPQISSR
jgi:hypothetical protein